MSAPNVIRCGDGPEPVLGLHCLLAYGQSLEPLLTPMSDMVQARLMDLPGHGDSPNWTGEQPYGDVALSWALSCLDGPAHVIGHSYGGYLALRLAVEHPDLVRSLTLIDPVFMAAAGRHDQSRLEDHLMKASSTFRALADGDNERAAQYFMAYWGGERDVTQLPPAVLAYCADRIQLVRATQSALMEDDVGILDRLGQLRTPVLLIEGQETPSVMAAICSHLEAEIPNTSRLSVQGAGHMAPITHPQVISPMIAEFIEAHQGEISPRN